MKSNHCICITCAARYRCTYAVAGTPDGCTRPAQPTGLTEASIIPLGFQFVKEYPHDQYHTRRYQYANLVVEFCYQGQELVHTDMRMEEEDNIPVTFELLKSLTETLSQAAASMVRVPTNHHPRIGSCLHEPSSSHPGSCHHEPSSHGSCLHEPSSSHPPNPHSHE